MKQRMKSISAVKKSSSAGNRDFPPNENESNNVPSSSDNLYNLMDKFYHTNMSIVHKDVKDFYSDNLNIFPDEDGLIDIITLDGSYSHIGYNSSWDVSFITELYTGRNTSEGGGEPWLLYITSV